MRHGHRAPLRNKSSRGAPPPQVLVTGTEVPGDIRGQDADQMGPLDRGTPECPERSGLGEQGGPSTRADVDHVDENHGAARHLPALGARISGGGVEDSAQGTRRTAPKNPDEIALARKSISEPAQD